MEKSNGSTGTIYWYMAPGIVAESDLSGNLQSEYIFFDGERVARKNLPSNAVSYYFSDHLKTASVITDSSGTIKEDEDYYPWGGELQFLNNDSNHYKFTGKERDAETGLDYFGARYYGSWLGRFITPDWAAKATAVPYAEFSDPQSLNLYSYVRNIPTTRFDADGHADAIPIPLPLVGDLGDALWTLGSVALPGMLGGGVGFAALTMIAGNNQIRANATEMEIHATNQLHQAQGKAAAAAKKGSPPPGTQTGKDGKGTTLQPGPHAGDSIPARGPQRDFTAGEREATTKTGQGTGCHTCGSTDPGTQSGNFVPDHQPPSALNPADSPQRLYPQCIDCSRKQGGEVRATKAKEQQ